MKPNTGWLGKIAGHIGQAKAHFKADAQQRKEAEEAPASIILRERDVQGEYDANRVLMTTLGGKPRPITADDLAAFRQNIRTVGRKFKGGGITARQVIDMAAGRPLGYADQRLYGSDIDKARREITSAVPVSAQNETIRFLTNAGKDSRVARHTVIVKLTEFKACAAALASAEKGDAKAIRKQANILRKGKLKFDCDCERHRYFFRYVATIGGFNAGRDETGYPKIRNPRLQGCACKHVLRVMRELESSNGVLKFLEKHLAGVSEYQARTRVKQKEAEESLKMQKPGEIKTSDQRKAEADRRKELRALKKAVEKKAEMAKKAKARTVKRKERAAGKTRKPSLQETIEFLKRMGFSEKDAAKQAESLARAAKKGEE